MAMRSKFKDGLNYRYSIINPQRLEDRGRGGRRATFAIEKRTYDIKTWKLTGTKRIENVTLDSINSQYRAKSIAFEVARKNVEELVESLYRKDKAVVAQVFSNDNLTQLQTYLDIAYPPARRRKLADFKTVEYECSRAVEALGNVSLLSATQDAIQDAVDAYCGPRANKQRRIITKLTSILKTLRPTEHFKLSKDTEEHGPVKHLAVSEFDLVLRHLPNGHLQTLAKVCFYLGCRVGEACALNLSDLKEARTSVLIDKQIRKSDHEARKVTNRTKNKKRREAFIFDEGIAALKDWIKVKGKLTLDERLHLARYMTEACKKVFADDEGKHLVWHDLRHSYAIRLLDQGLTIDDVADMIGDSVVVAKKHYIGFIVSDARMDRIRSKVNGEASPRRKAA